jgi:hypothetical protein
MVRLQYPPLRKLGQPAGAGPERTPTRELPTPTRALPGSSAKIAELCRRLSARQELWHPADAMLDLEMLYSDEEGEED